MATHKKAKKVNQTYNKPGVCHVGPKLVMKLPAALYADAWPFIAQRGTQFDLAIRLMDEHSQWGDANLHIPQIDGNREARDLLGDDFFAIPAAPTVVIHWPDFGTPRLTTSWWINFADRLAQFPDTAKIGVGCDGGHGRTGTFLAILASLAGQPWIEDGAMDSVDWVRKRYCEKAVESERQLDYIELITGEDVVSDVSAMSYVPSSWHYPAKPGSKGS